ncbi:hypothetical protein [Streptomyces sp. NPDC088789]|uniref:hypothetical protein n=1 Tax=Streptomyces sp. NPDC088789 TaxID=3365899 RepID=UPI0038062DB3
MATLPELAERGIAGSADVLPVPVGPEPQAGPDRAKAPWGRGEDGRPLLPMGAHWTDIPELVDQTLAGIQGRVEQAQSGSWFESPTAEAPDTVCTRYGGYVRTIGRFTNLLPADRELLLHAGSDLRWCLEMIVKLRARVAELEAQRERRRGVASSEVSGSVCGCGSVWHDGSAVSVPRTERSYWVAIADALNAAQAAGMPVGVDLDGTLTDRRAWSVVWDRAAERWAVAGYDDEPAEAPVSRPFPPRDAVCARSGCGHSGEEHHHGGAKCWARLPKHGGPVAVCGCSGFVGAGGA